MIKRLFLQDWFILSLILVNALTIFVLGFTPENYTIRGIDNIITILFFGELLVKIQTYGANYFKSRWNVFDFLLIVISLPTLITIFIDISQIDFSYLLILRVFRVFKTFRFLKFVPGIDQLLRGVQRALKASIIVIIGFIVYIFIISIFSHQVFAKTAPDYFGDPLCSMYTIFKMFTVEGWYEVSESVVSSLGHTKAFFGHLYFIFVVLSGGILGLSLVNSIFVDAMVSDNNDELKEKIGTLELQINNLIEKIDKNGFSN
ncbi:MULTISPECIES: ion transporter [unclassified Carboxylicivirga]|uniref:ion transporter n=1 Tax=Carboxylicivirga TaxID=1628153 RepID=UPI003D348ABA